MPGMNPEEAKAYVDELIVRAEIAMAEALNAATEVIFEESQIEVPKSDDDKDLERYGQTLTDSGRSPSTDPELAAKPGARMEASIVYEHPAAVAQHEGYMMYERNGEEIVWKVENYTTEGTKDHYLSDPFKAALGGLEAEIGAAVEEAIGGLPGGINVTGKVGGIP